MIFSNFHGKTFGSTLLEVTCKPMVFFIILFWVFQILYQCEVFITCGYDGQVHDHPETPEEAAVCNHVWHDKVTGMKENESVATSYLTFILGFYVGQLIKR